MSILRKHLPDNQKTKDKLAKLPKLYIICCLAHTGCLEYPFTGKYDENGIPLVYQFDDHNGAYWEYRLTKATEVTTGYVHEWTTNADEVQGLVDKWEKFHREEQERRNREYDEMCEKWGGADAYLMHFFGRKREFDTDQVGEDK